MIGLLLALPLALGLQARPSFAQGRAAPDMNNRKLAAQVFAAAEKAYAQKQWAESLDAYERWLADFGGSAKSKSELADKALATQRAAELRDKTGLLTIVVSVEGAEVRVDDKVIGKSPVAAKLRVTAGPHRVRVEKDGFVPVERAPNVPSGTEATTLDVKLEASAQAKTTGRVKVKEASGKSTKVLIDGTDMGMTPWEGELTPGLHELVLRGPNLSSIPQRIEVAVGETRSFDVVAVENDAQLRVNVEQDKGKIFIDGNEQGEGHATVMLPSGEHTLRVTRDEHEPFEKKILLKPRDVYTESVSLKLETKVVTQALEAQVRKLEGVYGGFGVYGTLSPTGLYSSVDTRCGIDGLGATCEAGTPFGGGLHGHLGYHWNPVGLELFMMGGYENTKQKATFDGTGSLSANRLAVGVPREEDFSVHRYGGLGAVRARMTVQSDSLRFSIAGGIGASYKRMALVRKATASDGTARTETYSPNSLGYVSPAIAIDASLGYRVSPTTALSLGILFTAENATLLSDTATEVKAPTAPRYMAAAGQAPVEIATPTYKLASGGQAFLGLMASLQFGP
jgi:PEGA domain